MIIFHGTNKKECTHILMNTSMIDEEWCYPTLKQFITEHSQVCIMAFSFFDDVKNEVDWEHNYGKQGIYYSSNVDVWKRYGIEESQIIWVNYFKDTRLRMLNKIKNSDIIFFTGGAPDKMMQRIHEYNLEEVLEQYQGLMIGYSAGAMIQLSKYHITPDVDYSTFLYEEGLACLSGFDIEVHYEGEETQNECIQKIIEEKKIPVYALWDDGGIVVTKNNIKSFGHVTKIEV